jgi:hypothetical protein
VLIDEQFRKCVVFLMASVPDPATGAFSRTPVATAFLVSVPIRDGADAPRVAYLVTARHVVDGSRANGSLYARLNLRDGVGFDDGEIAPGDWILHRQTDVALTNVTIDFSKYDLKSIPIALLATDEYVVENNVGVGDDVFFVGLFTRHPGQIRSEPVVRFGNVSLMPRQRVPIRMAPGDHAPIIDVDAYLVEARSWGGQSGSPAFVYYTLARERPGGEAGPGAVLTMSSGIAAPAVLGLVHGHYDIEQEVAFTGDILGSGRVPVNAGIAIVIPAQKIIDILMDEELVAQRHRLNTKLLPDSAALHN